MTFTTAKKEEIRLRYLEVDTSNVADVLDNMNLLQQGLSSQFSPFPDTTKRMAGWAYTIRGQMRAHGIKFMPLFQSRNNLFRNISLGCYVHIKRFRIFMLFVDARQFLISRTC